jgi:exodeoxyribonuclease V gamma subunit
MVHLHYSNRLEDLVIPLARTLAAQQSRDPLTRAVIIVPNRIIEEFLKLRLAEISGVAANLEFPFLRRYLGRMVAAADPSAALLEADELELIIFECLRSGLEANEPELSAVADYVDSGSKRAADREMRLFELSARTAHLFREYSISRPALLARWRRGFAPELEPMRETERWQRYLFLSIFGPDGRLLARWINGERRPYFLLNAMLEQAAPDKLKAALGAPLHLFGLSYAGPEFVRAFDRLGSLTALHIYALNPCMEFWEDADGSYAGVRELAARRGHKLGAVLESVEDPFDLDNVNDNLALVLWGKPGREYIRLLNELTDCEFDAHFKHPLKAARKPTLLGRIQEAILCREPNSPTLAQAPGFAADESLRFLGCPGIRREVEIVADAIWSLIRDDAKNSDPHPLRFHQIALLIPDAQLDAYLPHVEPVFAQRYQIPLNLIDRPYGAEAAVVEAVQLLLELPKSRFNRDAVLHLITHPAIAGDAGVDTTQWDQWCRSAGVFFGADATALAPTYIPSNFYHWDQGLRRLALGVFMDAAQDGSASVVAGPDGDEYLPCATAQDDLPAVAALIARVRCLLMEALEVRERRLPLHAWAPLLSDFVKAYIRPADTDGRTLADYCAGAIESMAPEELRGEAVGYEVACAHAVERIQTAQSEQGRYAEGGVAVGSFSALRSIPFRAIFALGMGENIFPQRERRDLLDLRTAYRRAGDVSPSQRDRYLFLETLLAARERFIMSWVSRDALTGQQLEPSPLIAELQSIAAAWLSKAEIEKLTIIHPRNTYDPEYFPALAGKASAGLTTFDRNAPNAARMVALRADLEKSCGREVRREELTLEMLAPTVREKLAPALRVIDLPLDGSDLPAENREINLPLAALRKYLECPLQGAAQYALGMLVDDDGDEEDTENEPLVQSVLDRVMLLRESFWQGGGEIEPARAYFDRAMRVHQLAGQAPVGPFADAAGNTLLKRLQLCVEQARTIKITSLEGWKRVRIGGAAEDAGDADLILDPIRLEVPMRRRGAITMLRIALRGTVTVSSKCDQSILCVARKSDAEAHHFLSGFLGAIALTAAGKISSASFDSIVLGAADETADAAKLTRTLKVPSQDQAKKYLTQLAEDIFSGTNNYFLPLEAVRDILKRKRKLGQWPNPREITDFIEHFRENDLVPCRSIYGPIRDPRQYPVPNPGEVVQIIKRRFGPIITIFGEGNAL